MPAIFDKMHHLCIVVHDMEKAVDHYTRLGVGPWQAYPPMADYVELDVPDRKAFEETLYRFVNLANMQIQLCQPGPRDSPQRRFLDAHGEGVFHISFEVPDCGKGEAAAKAQGLKVLMRGRRANRSGFTFLTRRKRSAALSSRSAPMRRVDG